MRVVLALAALATAGCMGSEPVPFAIVLEFGNTPKPPESRACELSCDMYEIGCDAKLLVRIADAEGSDRAPILHCRDVPVGGTFCDLAQVEVMLPELPLGPAHLQVALWRTDDLPDGRCPLEPEFDLRGEPLMTFQPEPVIGHAIYFDIGSAPEARLNMTCVAPERLSTLSCSMPDLPE